MSGQTTPNETESKSNGLDDEQLLAALASSNLCLIAGAGSGKTTTMVEHILRFIEADPNSRSVASALAITFTDKAAAEIRQRIGQALWARRQNAENKALADLWTREIRALSQAYIGTIHGYALSLLKDYSFYLGLPADFQVADQGAASDLADFVYDSLAAFEPNILTLLSILPWRGFHYQASLEKILTPIMERLGNWGLEALKLFPALNDASSLMATFKEKADQFKADLEIHPQRRSPKLYVLANDTSLLELVQGVLKDPAHLAKNYDILTTAKKLVDDVTKSSVQTEAKKATLAAAKELISFLDDHYARPALEALVAFSAKLGQGTRAKRARRGVVNFNDILILARDLLRERPLVRRRELAKWQIVAVDEFQDTNRLQTDLLALILSADPEPVTFSALSFSSLEPRFRVFGDSNQSIYRFRGAESSIMDGLALNLPQQGGETLAIKTNYRSQTRLVEFYNELFSDLFQNPKTGQEYLKQKPSRADLYPGQAVAFLTEIDPEKRVKEAWATRQAQILVAYLKRLFAGQTQVIVEISGQNRETIQRVPTPGDVAILVRRREYAPIYEAALSQAGWPCQVLEGRGYATHAAIAGLTAFYFAAYGWGLDYHIYAFLRSPLGPISHEAIETLIWPKNATEPLFLAAYFTSERKPFPAEISESERRILEECRELFLGVRALIDRRPLGEILETVLECRRLLPLLAGFADGLNLVKIAQKFLAAAKGLVFHDPFAAKSPLSALTSLWTETSAKLEEGDPEGVLAPAAINILTIHQAKGLQFPVTILPEADRELKHKGPKPLLIDDAGYLAIKFLDSNHRRQENALYANVLKTLEEAEYLENQRLLYVAATRARDHLVFIGQKGEAKKPTFLTVMAKVLDSKQVATISDWPELSDEAAPKKEPSSARQSLKGSGDGLDPLFDPQLLGPLPETGPLYLSVTEYCHLLVDAKGLSRATAAELDPLAEARPLLERRLDLGGEDLRDSPDLEDGGVGPAGPTVPRLRGILFHALLEATDYDWDEGRFQKTLEVFARRWGQELSGPEAAYLVEKALEFQSSSLGQEAKAAYLANLLWRERNFWLKVDDNPKGLNPVILNGIMDLFYLNPDDTCQIVDYKLAKKGPAPVYQKQLEIYARAVKAAGFKGEVKRALWFAERGD
ncbi:MAG: UvrD-helicase domain-containing protein [Deltaproteobacteria bacterium]|jgi:ATP-dependent helicase/nuclease subunit A|nr:UvrD-helicase domain-containing protein [Deltaproteobacteria bacterium]